MASVLFDPVDVRRLYERMVRENPPLAQLSLQDFARVLQRKYGEDTVAVPRGTVEETVYSKLLDFLSSDTLGRLGARFGMSIDRPVEAARMASRLPYYALSAIGAGVGNLASRLLLGGGLSYLGGTAETGSRLGGAIQGATALAVPKAAELVSQRMPSAVGRALAGEIAGTLTAEAGGQLTSLATTGRFYNPLDPLNVMGNALFALPSALNVAWHALGAGIPQPPRQPQRPESRPALPPGTQQPGNIPPAAIRRLLPAAPESGLPATVRSFGEPRMFTAGPGGVVSAEELPGAVPPRRSGGEFVSRRRRVFEMEPPTSVWEPFVSRVPSGARFVVSPAGDVQVMPSARSAFGARFVVYPTGEARVVAGTGLFRRTLEPAQARALLEAPRNIIDIQGAVITKVDTPHGEVDVDPVVPTKYNVELSPALESRYEQLITGFYNDMFRTEHGKKLLAEHMVGFEVDDRLRRALAENPEMSQEEFNKLGHGILLKKAEYAAAQTDLPLNEEIIKGEPAVQSTEVEPAVAARQSAEEPAAQPVIPDDEERRLVNLTALYEDHLKLAMAKPLAESEWKQAGGQVKKGVADRAGFILQHVLPNKQGDKIDWSKVPLDQWPGPKTKNLQKTILNFVLDNRERLKTILTNRLRDLYVTDVPPEKLTTAVEDAVPLLRAHFRTQGYDNLTSRYIARAAARVLYMFRVPVPKALALLQNVGGAVARGELLGAAVRRANQMIIGLNLTRAGDSLARVSTVLGHEMIETIRLITEHLDQFGQIEMDVPGRVISAYKTALAAASELTPDERKLLVNEVLRKFGVAAEDLDMDLDKPEEFIANLYGAMAARVASHESWQNLPDLSGNMSGLTTVWLDMVNSVLDLVNHVLPKNPAATKLRQAFVELLNDWEEIVRWEHVAASDLRLEAEPWRILYSPFWEEQAGRVAFMAGKRKPVEQQKQPGQKPLTIDDLLGTRPTWFERFLGIPGQLAKQYPQLRPILDLGFRVRAMAESFAIHAYQDFLVAGKFGGYRVDVHGSGLARLLNNPDIRKALSFVFLEQNAREKTLSQQELYALLKKHLPRQSDVDFAVEMYHKLTRTMNRATEATLRYHVLRAYNPMLNVLMQLGIPVEEASRRLQVITDAFDANYLNNLFSKPKRSAAEYARAFVNGLTAVHPGEEFQAFLKTDAGKEFMEHMTKLGTKLGEMIEFFQSRPWYSPEVRLGRYHLRYIDAQKMEPVHLAFKTLKELEDAIAEINAGKRKAVPDSVRAWDDEVRSEQRNKLTVYMLNLSQTLELMTYEALKKLAKTPEELELLDKYVPLETTKRELAAQGIGRYMLPRSLVGGREQLDMIDEIFQYVEAQSHGLSARLVRERAALFLPLLSKDPALANMMQKYLDTMLNPPANEFRKLKGMVYHMFLYWNPSTYIIERMQPLFSLIPELMREGRGYFESLRLLQDALKRVYNPKLDPELQGWLQRARLDMVIGFGLLNQLDHERDTSIVNLANQLRGLKALKVPEFLARPAIWMAEFGRTLYNRNSDFNNVIAFAAGYLDGKRRGMTQEQAYEHAKWMVRSTMFGGGAAARPIGLFANMGKAYGLAGLWYTMRQYQTAMYYMFYRYAKEALDKKLPLKERLAAKKGLATMILTHFAFAGVRGLPLVGGALAFLDWLKKDANVQGQLYELIANAVSDDDETGGIISDAILNGFAPKLFGLGIIDVSQRFSLGHVPGMPPSGSPDPTELLGGVVGGAIADIVQSLRYGLTGDWVQAMVNVAPLGLARNVVRYISDGGKITTGEGNVIIDPTPAERAAWLMGFQPRRVAKYREAQRLAKQEVEAIQTELDRFHEKVAELMIAGRYGEAYQQLVNRWLSSGGHYDLESGIRSALRQATGMVAPVPPVQSVPGEAVERLRRRLWLAGYRPQEVPLGTIAPMYAAFGKSPPVSTWGAAFGYFPWEAPKLLSRRAQSTFSLAPLRF